MCQNWCFLHIVKTAFAPPRSVGTIRSVIVEHGAFPRGDNSDRHFSLVFLGTVTGTGKGGNSDGHLYLVFFALGTVAGTGTGKGEKKPLFNVLCLRYSYGYRG